MPRAGLDTPTVTAAGAALADEIGFPALSMGLLAERLGVRTPSLYKHVEGLADLSQRIAVLAVLEVGDAVRGATRGLTRGDALAAAAAAMREYVVDHPGRYAATTGARFTSSDDPLALAGEALLGSLADVLRGYGLDPAQEVHALRMLRSVLHGFSTLEADGGFQLATDVGESFSWLIAFLDHGLRATTSVPG